MSVPALRPTFGERCSRPWQRVEQTVVPIRELDLTVSSAFSDVAFGEADSAPLVSREGDRTVVWLGGECDIATVVVLDEALTKAISDDRRDLIVDLSGVTFIGTVTIDALILARSTLRRQFRSLTVRSPSRWGRLSPALAYGLGMCRSGGKPGQWAAPPGRFP